MTERIELLDDVVMPLAMAPLLERIEPGPGGCWLWTAGTNSGGYAQVKRRGKKRMVHRLVYELLVGPIPEALVLDHLCRVRHCVNPAHLEPVTQQVNIGRGVGLAPAQTQRTHCPAGHPYDEANTYRTPSRPNARYCRTCHRSHSRAWHARNPR
ncbi:MAG: hypothetical protein SHS37scaffold145_37 [Phage 71_18]|nr:MAG: hypothetical protein SHS37scaffold145_37 [Phage 71_18]